jgi:hypothetical protein
MSRKQSIRDPQLNIESQTRKHFNVPLLLIVFSLNILIQLVMPVVLSLSLSSDIIVIYAA